MIRSAALYAPARRVPLLRAAWLANHRFWHSTVGEGQHHTCLIRSFVHCFYLFIMGDRLYLCCFR